MEEIQKTPPVELPKAGSEQQAGLSNRQIVGIVLIVIVVLAIISALIFGMVTHPLLTSIVRDIAIIVLALVTIVMLMFITILIFQLQSLIVLLRNDIKPILDSANETASTVRGTTTFVTDAVVTPMIGVASFAAGVGQTFRTLARTGHKKERTGAPPPGPSAE